MYNSDGPAFFGSVDEDDVVFELTAAALGLAEI
jgi:hypothetical protein